jgi:hypothetical protein
MAWFPIYRALIESEKFRRLTPTQKIYFWYLVSRFNKDEDFYQSDLEIAKTLATSEKTIRRGRSELTKMGLIEAKPGQLMRNRPFATRYLLVRYANMGEGGHFSQIQRFAFETMLNLIRKGRLQHGDVVVYICLYYWYWQKRGKYEDKDRFFITKKELQSLTNLQDAAKRVSKIYDAFVFSGPNESHLFEYWEEYHRFVFEHWSFFADPDENEISCRIAERRLEEIKELVANEKRDRQVKLQQQMVKPSNDLFPSPIGVFYELYMNRYHRRPHFSGDNKIAELEKNFGRGVICRAIEWYLVADTVPKRSGAKTRTLDNFTKHIDEIIELSKKSRKRCLRKWTNY